MRRNISKYVFICLFLLVGIVLHSQEELNPKDDWSAEYKKFMPEFSLTAAENPAIGFFYGLNWDTCMV